MLMKVLHYLIFLGLACACVPRNKEVAKETGGLKNSPLTAITPKKVTQKVANDTDDPAIWINREDPTKSLIIGTDKGNEEGVGALYVFDLDGKIVDSVNNIQRPNNVDVAYDFNLGNERIDIAVCTERYTHSIRVFRLPSMTPVDNGGIPVFVGDTLRAPMGVALFTEPTRNTIYAIVGRKYGPKDGYLWQYELYNENGVARGKLVRKFGKFSGSKEIEAIAVDNELGYVYYSDENVGVRKYYAHPDSSNTELALFAQEGFTDDHEGISIFKKDEKKGYILVSDQQANTFHIYPREGSGGNAHNHPRLKSVLLSTLESDGNEVTSMALNQTFAHGLFVAMSDDGTFHYYHWQDIAGEDLK